MLKFLNDEQRAGVIRVSKRVILPIIKMAQRITLCSDHFEFQPKHYEKKNPYT